MISVSLFLHPDRRHNLSHIHDAYKDYDTIDEVVIVTGKEVATDGYHPKFKFIHMPGPYTYGTWPCFGLLSRYTFALSCKNRFVFMQDDDCFFYEHTLQKLHALQEPLVGTKPTPRWFHNERYQASPPSSAKAKNADIVITRGIMVDSHFLPYVIGLARAFWGEKHQRVFNGEDIFLSRAMARLTKKDSFSFVEDAFVELPTQSVQLHQKINKGDSRSKITREIYAFFSSIASHVKEDTCFSSDSF